jgi:uncharacterized protein (TIGR02145 family)
MIFNQRNLQISWPQTNRILSVGLALSMLALSCRYNAGDPDSTLTDIDGNRYQTLRIGTQIWMAENLRVTRTPDGNLVPWHFPNDDSSCVMVYGLLYDWQTALQSAPKGWHVPSNEEWDKLAQHLGALGAAKLKDTLYWRTSSKNVTNETGFSARPAGYWNDSRFDNQFGLTAVFWSSTQADSHFVWSRTISADHDTLRRVPQHPQYGFSVRCVKDSP